MTDVETLAERVETVERAVTDGDHAFPAVGDIAELAERVETVERRVEELDERTAELEGATQALRGYVGNVRSVNERVEQRADTALAATERLERRLDASDTEPNETGPNQRTQHPHSDEPMPRETTAARTGRGEHTAAGDAGMDVNRGHAGSDTAASATAERPTAAFELSGDGAGDRGSETDESAEAGILERMRSLL